MTSEENKVQPTALSAFLTPPSRNATLKDAKVNTLSPSEVSQKIASLLRPGPPFYSTVSSSDLIDHLSDASIMNGLRPQQKKHWFKPFSTTGIDGDSSQTPWTEKGTVWSNLDSLPSGTSVFAIPNSVQIHASSNEQDHDDGLWSSIMVSCDLKGEGVELNKSCVIPTHVLTENNFYLGNKAALFSQIGAGTTYKWDDWSSERSSALSLNAPSLLSLYTVPTLETWSWPSWLPWGKGNNDSDRSSENKQPSNNKGTKRVWIPSTTKVSVHASWWGFTIYLPQAVLPEIESDVQQAEKIAQIIHTVLTTLLDKASSLPVPAPLQAALTILKAIAPSTSYISTFIGWSWDQIKSFNKGEGVELSATWLLPIALIPHTWDAATAPADKDGDGAPDGPPQEGDKQTPAGTEKPSPEPKPSGSVELPQDTEDSNHAEKGQEKSDERLIDDPIASPVVSTDPSDDDGKSSTQEPVAHEHSPHQQSVIAFEPSEEDADEKTTLPEQANNVDSANNVLSDDDTHGNTKEELSESQNEVNESITREGKNSKFVEREEPAVAQTSEEENAPSSVEQEGSADSEKESSNTPDSEEIHAIAGEAQKETPAPGATLPPANPSDDNDGGLDLSGDK